jgi:hypothetical protein
MLQVGAKGTEDEEKEEEEEEEEGGFTWRDILKGLQNLSIKEQSRRGTTQPRG